MEKVKYTQKERFAQLLEIAEVRAIDGMVEFLEGRIEQLNKKSAKGTQTKGQKANAEMQAVILKEMEIDRLYTVTELMKEISVLKEYVDDKGNGISNQKASSLVSGLVKVGKIERITSKGRSYFKVVVE